MKMTPEDKLIAWFNGSGNANCLVIGAEDASDPYRKLSGGPYDLIIMVGVLERLHFEDGLNPAEDLIARAKKYLSPEGHLIFTMSNRLGLQVFAGHPDSRTGECFKALEKKLSPGYTTRKGLGEFCALAGLSADDCHIYYPFPSLQNFQKIFSDRRLPHVSECRAVYEDTKYRLFDENLAFDTIIRDGCFPLFANDFLCAYGPKPEEAFVSYSETGSGTVLTTLTKGWVKKRALDDGGKKRLELIRDNYEKVSAKYEGTGIHVCPNYETAEGPELGFPFQRGMSLDEMLDEKLFEGDIAGFRELFEEYISRISGTADVDVCCMDLTFDNIVADSGSWILTDYEHVLQLKRGPKALALYALRNYISGDPARLACDPDSLCARLSVSGKMREKWAAEDEEIWTKMP